MEIIIIVAMSQNRVIGRQQTIPWHIPGEQLRFKRATWGHPLIMGRKTFASIGRALPGRRNIVVSRDPTYPAPGGEVATSLEDALARCVGYAKVFVIGGEQIFREALAHTDTVILTTIPREVAGDTFFPVFEHDFTKVGSELVTEPEPYTVAVYRRRVDPAPSAGTGLHHPSHNEEQKTMPNSVYQVVEFVGTSKTSWEDAAKNAIDMARKKYSDLRVATIKELDMTIEGEMVSTFRAKVNISFKFHS